MNHGLKNLIAAVTIVFCVFSFLGCTLLKPAADAVLPEHEAAPEQSVPPEAPDPETPPEPPEQDGPLILISVPEPGGGMGLATVEIRQEFPFTDDPSQYVFADFKVEKEGKTLELLDQLVYLADQDLAVWLDDHRVLLNGSFLADVTGEGTIGLTSGGSVSPDRTYIVGWSVLTGGRKSWVLLSALDFSLSTIKSFSTEDWGTPEYGSAPRACWLDENTVLFDGPYQQSPAVYQYDVESGRARLLFEHAWGIRASLGGKYLTYMTCTTWGSGTADGPNRLVIRRGERGEPLEIPSVDSPHKAKVYWNEEINTVAVVDGTTVLAMRIGDTRLTQIAKQVVSGVPLAVEVTTTGVRFLELFRKDGVPIALVERFLLFAEGK